MTQQIYSISVELGACDCGTMWLRFSGCDCDCSCENHNPVNQKFYFLHPGVDVIVVVVEAVIVVVVAVVTVVVVRGIL